MLILLLQICELLIFFSDNNVCANNTFEKITSSLTNDTPEGIFLFQYLPEKELEKESKQ